ncbi:MAG: hypothetical protein ACT6Q3_11680, partial [Sphingopyxis sp.]
MNGAESHEADSAPFFRTNRRPPSTNCKTAHIRQIFVQLGDREGAVFPLSKAPTRPPVLGFP